MSPRRVTLVPDLKVNIAQDAQFCAYQTAGAVIRVPELQHYLRRYAAIAEVCENSACQDILRGFRERADRLKGEIAQGMANAGRCQFEFPAAQRLLGQITEATRDGSHDTAYQIARELIPAVFSDLAARGFTSGVEKQLEAEARAKAEAAQREREMALWREEVRRARVEKGPEPPLPARWREYYTIEEEPGPRKRGRPRGSAPLSRRPGGEA